MLMVDGRARIGDCMRRVAFGQKQSARQRNNRCRSVLSLTVFIHERFGKRLPGTDLQQ